jgi:hypothetical protein
MSRRHYPFTRNGYLVPTQDRTAADPTEYEAAAAAMTDKDLRHWVERNYRTKYVPETVLAEMGLQQVDFGE